MFLFFYPAKVDIFSYDMTEYGVSAPTYDGERLRKNSRFFFWKKKRIRRMVTTYFKGIAYISAVKKNMILAILLQTAPNFQET